MTLDAAALTSFQHCPRQWILNQSGERHRWRPKTLFLSIFRWAIMELGAGKPLAETSNEACCRFLESAANPGLDVEGGIQPYILAKDFTAILKNSLARVHACKVPPLRPGPRVIITDSLTWACRAFQTENGSLYAWTAVDSLNPSILAREFHSWYVFGDIAAAGVPMTLNVLEVGRRTGSHQHTAWCRAYRHPAIAKRFAFQKKGGGSLGPGWKPVWFQDSPRNNADTWIEMMERDGVRALHSIPVSAVSESHRAQFRKQIQAESIRMEAAKDWREMPMCRASCDSPPCTWQPLCYASSS